MNPFSWGSDTWTAIATIVAIIALFRPDFARIRQARRTSAKFFPVGLLELGFGELGPSLTVIGSLISQGSRRVVVGVGATATRMRDGAKVETEWLLLRPMTIGPEQGEKHMTLRIVQPFPIGDGACEPLNVLLVDQIAKRDIERMIADVKFRFMQFSKEHPDSPTKSISWLREEYNKNTRDLFGLWEKMNEIFPWRSDKYNLEINIKTADGKKEIVGNFSFQISEDESKNLKSNIVLVEDIALGVPTSSPHQSVFIEYRNS